MPTLLLALAVSSLALGSQPFQLKAYHGKERATLKVKRGR